MDNMWIAALDPADRRRIEPHLHERPFAQGQMLYDAGETVEEVWFPMSGVVSLMTILDGDRMIETAAIGREGLVGVTCGPMNTRAASRAIAQVEGVSACCPADVFAAALEARLARWLLTIHDRAEGDRFALTQADIAGMLGVRRATVSEVGADLVDKGLIERGRGWVEVTDRKALEKAACGCYGAMRDLMKDLGVPRPSAPN
jgi:CRP-like cAMP-binding protein